MKSPARVRFVVYNGKPIPVVDVTNRTPEEGKSVRDEAPTVHHPPAAEFRPGIGRLHGCTIQRGHRNPREEGNHPQFAHR